MNYTKTHDEKVLGVWSNRSSTKRNDTSSLKHVCFREVIYIYIHTYDPVLTPPQRIIYIYVYIYIYPYIYIYLYNCIRIYIYKHHLYTDLPKFWFPSTTNDFTNSPRYTSLHRTCPSKHRRLLQHASQISFDLRGSKKVKKTKDVSEMSTF